MRFWELLRSNVEPLEHLNLLNFKIAQMAKLVDALPSGGSIRKDVQVRILFWARTTNKLLMALAFRGFLFLR